MAFLGGEVSATRNAVSMESACELCSCFSIANHPRCDRGVHRFPLDGTQRRCAQPNYPIAPTEDAPLLVGLLRCGHRGRKLDVRYCGGRGTHARYLCKGETPGTPIRPVRQRTRSMFSLAPRACAPGDGIQVMGHRAPPKFGRARPVHRWIVCFVTAGSLGKRKP
jgi:hypothetical protein